MKTLGEQVKAFREKKGWNTAQMAQAAGTSRQNIESLEQHGNRIPKYIGALAVAMETPLDLMLATAGLAPPGVKLEAAHQAQDPNEVTIQQYAAGGSMGSGLVLEDRPPGIIKRWHVDHEWLRLNVRHHSGIHNLRIVTGFGPSMRPMFNPGDPLLLDVGQNSVEQDAVYFFRTGDHGFIKMLQRIPTLAGMALRAKSKNPDYDPFDITPAMLAQDGYFEVFGKILTVWKSEVL